MRSKILLLTGILIMANCATYKQLKPKPELSNQESPGYVELKKGKKNFTLKKDTKYFIAFPAPQYDHFYLIVTSPQKQKFADAFTADFAKKEPGQLIANESWAPDSMSVYPVDRNKPAYYWLVQQVPQKVEEVALQYRYAPQWRFKFEHKYESYKQTLFKNRVDRTTYNAIGESLHLDEFNYTLVSDSVSRHTAELLQVRNALDSLESIFPPNVVNSADVAYQNYTELKNKLVEEIDFQTNYADALSLLYRDYQTKGNAYGFLGYLDDFINYYAKKRIVPGHITKEIGDRVQRRFAEVPAFYDDRLHNKEDAQPFDTAYFRMGAVRHIATLYTASGLTMTPEVAALVKFMTGFDAKSLGLAAARDSLAAITKFVKTCPNMPPDDFFKGVNGRIAVLQAMVPAGIDESYGTYRNFSCAKLLNQGFGELNTALLQASALYRDAATLVMQLNNLKAQGEYSAMIGLLKQNPALAFLIDKYRDLDRMSLEAQGGAIGASLARRSWAEAEAGLRKLAEDQNFLDPSILPQKEETIRNNEDLLYSGVESVTRARVDKFCEDNVSTYENIDSLYADSVFAPAYNITFPSSGRSDLAQRKDKLAADLQIKENEFPAKSILLLYDQFVKSPDDNGVLKARAIVAHGKHYTGDEKEVKIRISEADPLTAKWITKAKEYRRVLVVPVTDHRHGANKYVVRFDINVPTDAVFPVYDVNIKLPREVAQNAASEKWYDEITLNKVPLKNEGRFAITAPTTVNNYECQITPVQMNKDQTNVLEIVFHHNAFKVVQVSVMVQKPIIKKN